MRKSSIVILAVAITFIFSAHRSRAQNPATGVHAPDNGLALTPPMGWYPWNEFGQEPQNERLIKEIVDALVSSGLKEAGYTYIGPDEGICFSRDASGKLTSNLARYPNGLRGLGDYIHNKGLKYALYTDAGGRTCSKAMPGTKDHEYEDMVAFAEWRADYLKVDWCNTEGQDVAQSYTKLRDALRAAGRPIVYSLCSWGEGEPWKWAAAVGNLWRTTGDICAPGKADWDNAMKIAASNERLYAAAGPGHWNDPDMMIAGMDGLSEAQNRSFFSLWCMMAAPLMAGNDLRKTTPTTVQILTNLEAIGINQDPLGIQGRIVRREGNVEIWASKRLFDGSQAVLVFNQGAAPAQVQVAWSDIGLEESAALYVRDLWTHRTTGPHSRGISVTVPPNDVALLRVATTNAFPLPPIIVADSYLVSLRAAESTAQKLSGAITVKTNGSGELPLWKVQPGLPSWLSVAVTRNGKSQTLTNTVSTAGLKKGLYHALVRADNIEPVSGRPTSALYYDVDLEITGGRTIDPELAARYFEEAEAISRRDGGRLWGVQLYAPMLFADPPTRSVVANQADRGGQLKAQGKVFVGKLPENVNIANTATSWEGVTWTMVRWPLPQDPEDRAQLMIHELWHRAQAGLGFPLTNPANAHLDSLKGRLWLQLEWRALGRALTSAGTDRHDAIEDALVFRAYRRHIFPAAASEERGLEMHEGLAEYTGLKLASASDQRARERAAHELHEAESNPTFVRSFAYASGPAYGLLLDETTPGWRSALKASDDFGTLLAASLSLYLPNDLETVAEGRANSYDGDKLRAAEAAREAARQRRLAEYHTRLVEGPVLIIPLLKMNVQFNPNNLEPLGDLGTVYPTIRVTDLWGILTVTGGALLSPQWTEIRVPAPPDPQARPLQGDGWTLVPEKGWAPAPGERVGDYVLKPENTQP